MSDLHKIAATDFETAYRIARTRGMAERSRIFTGMIGAAASSVRGLFSQPGAEGRSDL